MRTKRFFILLFILLRFEVAYSQGEWDINYIPLDSLSTSLIGKEIRVDFKESPIDTITKDIGVFDIRRLLSKSDTIILELEGSKIEFVEKWVFYVDDGILKNQFLEGYTNSGGIIQIREMTLLSIDNISIVLEANYCYQSRKCSFFKKTRKEEIKTKISISKEKVKGLLIRISD